MGLAQLGQSVKSEESRKAKSVANLARYHRLRMKGIEMLGGVCVNCASTDDLQFDHIDPSSKSFTVTSKINNYSWEAIEAELKKC
jgi:5-methylcytosine-specific restriction endonuclease McrA